MRWPNITLSFCQKLLSLWHNTFYYVVLPESKSRCNLDDYSYSSNNLTLVEHDLLCRHSALKQLKHTVKMLQCQKLSTQYQYQLYDSQTFRFWVSSFWVLVLCLAHYFMSRVKSVGNTPRLWLHVCSFIFICIFSSCIYSMLNLFVFLTAPSGSNEKKTRRKLRRERKKLMKKTLKSSDTSENLLSELPFALTSPTTWKALCMFLMFYNYLN